IDPADDRVADFSSAGTTRLPDLVAPGTAVVSLRVPGSQLDQEFPNARVGERWFRGSGTSQATAVVSGLAALLLGQRPDLVPDQVKALLTAGADRAGDPVRVAGSGRADAARSAGHPTPDPSAVRQTWTPAVLDATVVRDLPPYHGGVHLRWWMLAVGFAATELFVVHAHVRGSAHSLSLSELPLILGLLLAHPQDVVIAQVAGPAVVLLLTRGHSP